MIIWIKGVLLVGGLLLTGFIHYLWPNKPQEEVMDNLVEKVIEDTTGFNIDPLEEAIDDIQDNFKQ